MKTNNMEYQEFDVQKKILHEDFEEKKDQYINDIAIVRVKTDGNRGIRFSSHVRPICLPSAHTTYTPGVNCTITGWGSSTNQHGSSN